MPTGSPFTQCYIGSILNVHAGCDVAEHSQVVISSSFESHTGMASLVALAATVDAMQASASSLAGPPVAHGLGTLNWFATNNTTHTLASCCPVLTVSSAVQQIAQAASQPSCGVAGGQVTQWCTRVEVKVRAQGLPACYTFHGRHLAACLTMHEQGSCATVKGNGSGGDSDCDMASSLRPVYVFLHGFLGSSEDWVPLMSGLAAAGHESMAVDLPGHGQTVSASGVPDIVGAADGLAALLQARGLAGRTILVGYSLGARVAMKVATAHPHLLRAAMFISGTPGIKVAVIL
jgi:isochorismate synthase / 2-succinyl-5-enolpyruvyl-6-hydroxy-3-cyclohexene-1-carboxylate synthase / 2-succinyl-6-hydroxy-2,4-cyclohexadiene-1-carboxylate synthase / o-succinylbenzoate synthase